ncbi:MAG: hypothetical protein WBC44_10210 [Planctomycetaceae bacterium]
MNFRTNLHRPHAGRRRGSTLIVVIALLASLMLLGFLFLTISSQEQENAYLFSNAAKVPQYAGSDYFDFALEQLILGARDDYYNSALWGGRASLLPTMFGNDLQPYNGAGVNLAWFDPDTPAGPLPGYAVVDQNFSTTDPSNPTPDDPTNPSPQDAPYSNLLLDQHDDDLLTLNLSPAAWFAAGTMFPTHDVAAEVADTVTNPQGMAELPPADVEYTTPDLASPFLCYVSYEPTTGKRIVIPSFHRPQYLRDLGIATADWYTNADTARRTMRPHRAHVAVTEAGNDSGETRFIDGGADAGGGVGSYPFDTTLAGGARDEGIWAGNVAAGTPPTFTADPDNDGLNEAEYIDLNYPEQVSADGTKTFVPLFAFTVYDADGLFNLNAHGNAYGNIAMYDAAGTPLPFGDTGLGDGVTLADGTVETGVAAGGVVKNDDISRSNLGTGPHAINASVGLDEPPTAGAAQLDQHERFFSHEPVGPFELANMEWWFLLAGRADLDASQAVTALYPGRWGEDNRLRSALSLMPYGASANPIAVTNAMPYPGGSQLDDQTPNGAVNGSGGDALFGSGVMGVAPNSIFDATGRVFPPTFVVLPHEQPLDVRGQGRFVLRTPGGKARDLRTPPGTRFRLPYYADYVDNGTAVTGEPNWRNHLGGDVLVGTAPWMGLYSTGGRLRIDHPDETTLDPTAASGGQDAIFSPGETATLQFSNSDQSKIAFSQRLLTLAPYNFGSDLTLTTDVADAELRRKMYATYSADTKTAGAPVHVDAVAFRGTEYDPAPADPANAIMFPPMLPATSLGVNQHQPFRDEVQALLRNISADTNPNPQMLNGQALVRKLSVNHVASVSQNNRIYLRPLTPHPITLNSLAIGRPAALLPPYVPAGPSPVPGFGMPDSQVAAAGVPTWAIGASAQLQEWHARRDRQNLARDIYVLLYTLSKANTTTVNPVTTPNSFSGTWATGDGTVYSLRELREMAQFAVNIVDSMDEDDNITCFVYDLNLADGYTNLDDGYASPVSSANADADPAQDGDGDGLVDNDFYDNDTDATPTELRGMVYGVETQQLALSEAMFALTQRVDDGSGAAYEDHVLTEWHDEKVRDFSFIELINVTPENVDISGQHWQVVVRPQGSTQPPAASAVAATAEERRLTLGDGVTPMVVGTGNAATYSIASAGDNHNRSRLDPNDTTYDSADPAWPAPASRMRINPTEAKATVEGVTTFSAAWMHIAPFAGADLDLQTTPPAYRLNSATPTGSFFRDGYDEDAFRRYTNATTPDVTVPEYGDDGLLFLGAEPVREALAATPPTPDMLITVELRRRLNVSRTAPDLTGATDEAISMDNPWVVVDTMQVPLKILTLTNTDETTTLQAAFQNLTSRERQRPLWRKAGFGEVAHDPATHAPPVAGNYIGNSLGTFYTTTAAPTPNFTIWQPHYNRPFASLGEVLGVPLYGPSLLTGLPVVPYTRNGPPLVPIPGEPLEFGAGLIFSSTLAPAPVLNRTNVAAARTLFPDGGTGVGGSPVAQGFYNNLWYRAFEYLSVPAADGGHQNYQDDPWFTVDAGLPVVNEQVRQQNDDTAGPYQRFGKLNLNTIRHPHVLAGMIDDFSVMARPTGQTWATRSNWNMLSAATPTETLDNVTMQRQWWNNFLVSRDGVDPYTNMIVPGLAVGRTAGGTSAEIIGRPFRSTSMAVRSEGGNAAQFGDHWTDLQHSLADTVFRRLPTSNMTNTTVYPAGTQMNVRGLFELGGAGEPDDTDNSDNAALDYTIRYRLLSKVLNHSTTRSNVFLVFIDVKYFNAKVKYTTPGGEKYVRIGAPDATANATSPRAFFVVDRTKALETISSQDLPQANQYIRPGATAPMVTSSFARNPDGTPTFDWRELVLSSVRIQ